MPRTTSIRNKLAGKNKLGAANYTINFRDAGFDGLYLYTMMYEWMCENGWHSRDDQNFPETLYIDRKSDAGSEIWIFWRMQRDLEGEPKGLATEHMDINFHFITLKSHEIVYKGKKMKTNKGEIELINDSYLILNEDYWSKKRSLLKQFHVILKKRIFRSKIMDWKRSLKAEAHKLREAINTYMKLHTFRPEKETGEYWLKRTGE